jgi:hypothetical protein
VNQQQNTIANDSAQACGLRRTDNVLIEWLRRSLKREDIHLKHDAQWTRNARRNCATARFP